MSIQRQTKGYKSSKTTPAYLLKGYDFPDGSVEMVGVPAPSSGSHAVDRRRGLPDNLPAEEVKRRRDAYGERCAQRAKSQIRRACRAVGVDRMATLTQWREKAGSSPDAMWSRWGECKRLLRKCGYDRHFVTVPERQKRGVWHLHLGYKGYIPKDVLWRCWSPEGYQAYRDGEGPGAPENPGYDFVDIGKRYGEKPIPMGKVVNYLVKYLGKSFGERGDELYNRKRYSVTVGAMDCVKEWRMYFDDLEEMLAMMSFVFGVEGDAQGIVPMEQQGEVVGYYGYSFVQ